MTDDVAGLPTVGLRAIVAWPRKMIVGKKYRIDVRLELKSEWPYEADSYQIGTMLSSISAEGWVLSVPTYVVDTTAMTLSRDGSCTSVHYVAEPATPGEHTLILHLITQGGVPFTQHKLPTVVETEPDATQAVQPA